MGDKENKPLQQPSPFNVEEAKCYKAVYTGQVDVRTLARQFPRVAAAKKVLLSKVARMPENLSGPALDRYCYKLAGAPVPDGTYTDNELRDALVAYKLPRAQGITVLSIVAQYGPSQSTLKRHGKRLQAACDMAKLADDASKEQVRQVAATLEFPKARTATRVRPTASEHIHTR